jgi:hypothetical protein
MVLPTHTKSSSSLFSCWSLCQSSPETPSDMPRSYDSSVLKASFHLVKLIAQISRHNKEKIIFSMNGIRKTGQSFGGKGIYSHLKKKKTLKVDHKLKCKHYNYKTSIRKHRIKSLHL